ELAGFGIFAGNVFQVNLQPAEFAFDVDIVAIARETRHGENAHARLIGADAGQAHGSRHIDVGRKAAAGFARRAGKYFLFLAQPADGNAALDQIRRAFEARRRFARGVRDVIDLANGSRLDAV